jgi:lipoate-protein ligase A
MRVVRGSTGDDDRDRGVADALLERSAETGEAGLFVHTPVRQVAFGRRDVASDGYGRACRAAREREYAVVERETGGRAVAHTGETLAFAYTVADADARTTIRDRYRTVTGLVERALRSVGAAVERGEPADSYCPGEHSLRGEGKLVGLAQRVREAAALVGGCVTVRERDEADIRDVLVPVYDALDVPFDPGSVGSVEGAGGASAPEEVLDALESAFAGGEDAERVAPVDVLEGA